MHEHALRKALVRQPTWSRPGRTTQKIVERRRTQPRLSRFGRLLEHVDGLTRTIIARIRHPSPHVRPERVDGSLLADDHSRLSARRCVGERTATLARRNDIRTDVAKRD